MDIQQLRKALHEGIVIFEFVKKDGTLRQARGTTSPELIPVDDAPIGMKEATKSSPPFREGAGVGRKTVAFYDIDKKAWRSMRIDTIWNWKRALKLT